MSTLTIRMPDEKVNRLKVMAARKNISLNKLIDELSTIALVEHDAIMRFEVRSMKGNVEAGLELLDKLDREEKGV